MKDSIIRPLVKQAMQGNQEAFDTLCGHIAADVLYICRKLTGNPQLGEDVAQEVFFHLQKDITCLRSEDAFAAWLNRCIARTCARMEIRERRVVSVPLEEIEQVLDESKVEFLPVQWAEKQERRELVLGALGTLPTRQQHLLFMFYFEELPLKQIARTLEISEAAAGMALTRARRALRREIEQLTGERMEEHSLSGAGLAPALTRILQWDAARMAAGEEISAAILVGSAAGTATAVAGSARFAGWIAMLCAPLAACALVGGALFVLAPEGAGGLDTAPQQLIQTEQGAAQEVSHTGPPSFVEAPQRPEVSDTSAAVPAAEPTPPAQSRAAAPSQSMGATASQARPGVQTSPAGSLAEPPPSQTGGGESQQEGILLIHGNILLQVDGILTDEAGGYGQGYLAEVWDGERLLASGVSGEDGRYALAVQWGREGMLTLRLRPAYSLQCGFLGGARVWTHSFAPAQADEAMPTALLVDDTPPTGYITFVDAEGRELEGAISPAGAAISAQDATETSAVWEIVAGDVLVQSGRGSQVSFAGLAGGSEGRQYTLRCTLTDLGGNTCVLQRDFRLISGL